MCAVADRDCPRRVVVMGRLGFRYEFKGAIEVGCGSFEQVIGESPDFGVNLTFQIDGTPPSQ